ncbi:MAG: sensor histidine kinase [Bacteroidota bacterium]
MKKFIFFFVLSYSIAVFSQEDLQPKIDALQQQIATANSLQQLTLLDSLTNLIMDKPQYKYDSIARVTIAKAVELDSFQIAVQQVADLIYYYGSVSESPEKGITVYEDYKHLISKVNDLALLCLIYLYVGDSYSYSGKLEESISFYTKSENFALQDKDSANYAISRTSKAGVITDLGDYTKSSKLLRETTRIFTRYKDTFNLAGAKSNLSILYSKMGFFEEAKKERDEAIELSLSIKDYFSVESYYHNASIDAYKTGNEVARIDNLKKAYKYGELSENGFSSKPIIVFELLRAYAANDSLAKAKTYFDIAKEAYSTKEVIPYEDFYRIALAEYYIATNKPEKALTEAKIALELLLDINDVEGIYEAYERLSNIYKLLDEHENAYNYAVKFANLKDSVNSLQKARALSYYQTLYETEKRDFKIASQKTEIAVLDQKNKVKQQWIIFGGLGLIVLFIIFYLIRSKKFAQKRQTLQQQFSRDLINAQEEERSRLARELHDSVGQKLMLLSKQTKKIENPNMEHLASSTLEEVRSISRGLHPSNLERMGLTMAINALVYDINVNTNLFFTEDIDNIDYILSKEEELHVYRIIQEVLSNVVKHSEAKAVKIEIRKKDHMISFLVSDNGKGFDIESKYKNISLGLKTLYERAKILGAQLQLDSKINDGTEMRLNISI